LGVFRKRATPAAGFSGLATGFVLGMTRLALKVFEAGLNPDGFIYKVFVAPNWLHYEIYLFALCLAVIVIVLFYIYFWK